MSLRSFTSFICLAVVAATSSLAAQPVRQTPVRTVAEWQETVDSLQRVGAKPRERGTALLELGRAYRRIAKPDSAALAMQRARTLATAAADTALMAESELAIGLLKLGTIQYDSALVYVARGRELWLAIGDSTAAGRTWNNTGAAHYQLGNYEQALSAFNQALRARRRANDTVGVARVLTNVGKVYQDWGQLSRAEVRLREAITVARQSGDPGVLGYALNTLAQVYVDLGRYDDAYRSIDSSMMAYARVKWNGSDSTGGWRLNATIRAEALMKQGHPEQAKPLLDSVVALARKQEDLRIEARALLLLGDASARLGNIVDARRDLTRSLELSRSVAQRVFMMQALQQLSALEEKGGNSRAALAALRAATALRDTIFNSATAERLAAEEGREERERQGLENASLREAQREQAAVIARQRLTMMLVLVILLLGGLLVFQLSRFNRLGRAREEALARTNDELRTALTEVRTLSGLIPICANCKRVRDDRGYWQAVESYITTHSDATFSHAICQNCGPELYGEIWPETRDT